ncbi:MAG: hypothetical protein HN509_14520 [Halobacteriovoraceae bacterium]|jgi:hypothetical protein|nr:hypothetical protein [Halobacteriovoraceae bacterium]MBT5094790.1 hypothetical protein [Halobacteriovoraceae bacterium]
MRKILSLLIFIILAGVIYYAFFNPSKKDFYAEKEAEHQKAKTLHKNTRPKKDPYKNRSLKEVESDKEAEENLVEIPATVEQRRADEEKYILELEREEFETLGRRTISKMPLKKNIRKNSHGEVHSIPEATMEAGRQLARLKKILLKRPEFIPQGLKNYYQCANQNDIPTSIRALCLTNFVQFKRQIGESVDMKKYPKDVVRLAKLALEI